MLRVAGYRFRTTLRSRWGGYVAVMLLVALLGGVALTSLLAARRTESSYPRFLRSTNPSGLLVQPSTNLSEAGANAFLAQIARLPYVRKVESSFAFTAATLTPKGGLGTILLTQVELYASFDGLFDSDLDRVAIIKGRRADPDRADEVVMSPLAASVLHLRVGSQLRVGVDTTTQQSFLPIYRKLDLRIVGEGVSNVQVVQDDIDKNATGFLIGTPALAREFVKCCSSVGYDALQLTPGSDASVVEHEYARLVATSKIKNAGGQLLLYAAPLIEAEAQRAIRPEATAFGVFGLVALLAALLIAGQAVSRSLRREAGEVEILRALGAGPRTTSTDGLPGVIGAVVAGALLAVAIAIGLSPHTLFGPVRVVDRAPGVYVDWTVFGAGALVLIGVLVATATAIAYRQAPHRVAARPSAGGGRGRAVRVALATALPTPAVVGLQFATESGRGRTSVPVRSAITGAVLAVVVVTGTLVFGASLQTLVSHPALYGWNFDDVLFSTDGFGPIPAPLTDRMLDADHDVIAHSGAYFANVEIDNDTVPLLVAPSHAAIAPPVLTGREVDGAHDVVLGPGTLASLHKRVGDRVVVSGQGIGPVTLRIVGTATFPSIGATLGEHASMSTGAVMSIAAVPHAVLNGGAPAKFANLFGPNAVFIRLRPGVNRATAQLGLDRVVRSANALYRSPEAQQLFGPGGQGGLDVSLLPVERPAEIANYRSMGSTPLALAASLAAGMVVALALTLFASVRRRRRDLALLKTLGFTRRQLLSAVAWQATAVAVVGVVIGVPLGIGLGHWLWVLFARNISAVPQTTVSIATIATVVLGAIVLANLAAAWPARRAARTSTSWLLHAD